MTPTRIVLGASDPEMQAIAALAQECGIVTVQATINGRPVLAASAYAADSPAPEAGDIWVECRPAGMSREQLQGLGCLCADHHAWDDAGYGRGPGDFLAASSIGQVIATLAKEDRLPSGWLVWPVEYGPDREEVNEGEVIVERGTVLMVVASPSERQDWVYTLWWARIPCKIVLAAAADHCLGAAYAGKCPGVDPDDLMRWRVESRAAFQRRPVDAILADIETTTEALRRAPALDIGDGIIIADMRHGECRGCDGLHGDDCGRGPWSTCPSASTSQARRMVSWPELPEAAARAGVGYVAGPFIERDGRRKYTCSGSPVQVRAWARWADGQGLTSIYGDPARGFAGGYAS